MSSDSGRLLPLLLVSVIFIAEIDFIRCRRISVLSPASVTEERESETAAVDDDSAIRDFAAKQLADLYGFDLFWKDKYGSMHEVREDPESNEESTEEKRFSEFLGGKRTSFSDSVARDRRRLPASAAAAMDDEAGEKRRFSEFIKKYKRFSEFLGGK